jgi:hypothetical protein
MPRRSNPETRRKARYRGRLARGAMVVPLELDPDLVDWLVSVGWLDARRSDDRLEIARAIGRMLTEAMRADRS